MILILGISGKPNLETVSRDLKTVDCKDFYMMISTH